MKIAKSYSILITLLTGFTLLTASACKCKKNSSGLNNENGKHPHAVIKCKNTNVRVGNYIVLDGSESTPGEGKEITWWEWKQDENNPADVFLRSGDDDWASFTNIGFEVEGIYRFTLSVNNGIEEDESDEIVITVEPRNNIIFEDPSLEIHVRFWLKKPVEKLDNTDLLSMDSLTSYRIIAGHVTSLNGIENCMNLKYLGMSLSRITDLSPMANLKSLVKLQIDQNHNISDISPLAGLTQLEWINMEVNNISDITPLTNLTKMTYLNVMFNPITDISSLKNMKNLEVLLLSNSEIGDISAISEMRKMVILWMSKCSISDISPLRNMEDLNYLYLDTNTISDVSALSSLTKIKELYLSHNQITDISPLENLTELFILNLGSNNIRDILPLVNNAGINRGDIVGLSGNPLNEVSLNEYIPALRERGVYVIN